MTLALSRRLHVLPRAKVLTVALFILAGDYLFFGQRVGSSLATFVAILAGGIFLTHRWSGRGSKTFLSSILFCGLAIIALAENISWISVGLAIAGMSMLAVNLKLPWYLDVVDWGRNVTRFVFSAPIRIFKDIRLFGKLRKRSGASVVPGGIVSWIVPITMTTVFAYFFAQANPLMDKFFVSLFTTMPDAAVIPAGRLFLWFGLLLMIWPFFSRHVMKAQQARKAPSVVEANLSDLKSRVLAPQSIIRSLVMFNILFAFQNGFDFTYLWAGAQLPDGMTYAEYAHRGAYPLLVTVLLAATFVLITMSRGSATEHNRLIRRLVYIWVAQNILLTFSSIDRLWLYVSAYSLTYLRVAAFIWMVLVAIGLVLIVVRLWRNYSNNWLLNSNMVNLVATLFVCAFINFGAQIAWFNVQQQRLVDLRYLQSIGPSALPAVKWLLANRATMNLNQLRGLGKISSRLEWSVQSLANRDWLELTWQEHRMVSWLAKGQVKGQRKITTSKFQAKFQERL